MRLLHLYTGVFGWGVRHGPFQGMRYVRESVCSTLAPKLLGTYELEIADWIELLIARNFPRVINIGAAEGYYAVGLARRCAGAHVVAFEGEAHGRTLLAALADRNRVPSRLTIEGYCTTENLRTQLTFAENTLLVVDIEGGEVSLLDPLLVPELRRCTMLVELHEHQHPAADILRARFHSSHHISERWTRPRDLRDLPRFWQWPARMLGQQRFINALSEHRPGQMRWFLCEPREAMT